MSPEENNASVSNPYPSMAQSNAQSASISQSEFEAVHNYANKSRRQLASLVTVFIVLAIIIIGVALATKATQLLIFTLALFLISSRLIIARKAIPNSAAFNAVQIPLPAKQSVTGEWSYFRGYSNLLPEFKKFKRPPGSYTGFQIGSVIILATDTKWPIFQWMQVLNQYQNIPLTVQYSAIYPNVPLQIFAGQNLLYDILN